MKNKTTISILLIAIITAAAAVVLVAGSTLFINTKINDLRVTLQTIADEQAIVSEQTALASVVARSTTDRGELQQYILQGDDGTVELLSLIDTAAAQLGIELQTKSLAVQSADNSPFDELAVTFSFSGAQANVLQLVSLFETLPYAYTITSLNLSRSYNPQIGQTNISGSISIAVSINDV